MGTLIQDIRYAVRRLASRPGLIAIIVVSIGLGIGANTLIFSFVNGMLLSGMPFPEPDCFFAMWFTPPNNPGGFLPAVL